MDLSSSSCFFFLPFKHFESNNNLPYKNIIPRLNSPLTEAYKYSGGDMTEIISELMLQFVVFISPQRVEYY